MHFKPFLSLPHIIKNSINNKLSIVKIKYSKKSLEILSILLKEGYIRGYFLGTDKNYKVIFILLKYVDDSNLLELKNVNLVKQREYFSIKRLKNLSVSFKNLLILSTKKGIMSHVDAINLNLGGFVVLNIS
jgi:ribosomal protein S8